MMVAPERQPQAGIVAPEVVAPGRVVMAVMPQVQQPVLPE